MSSSGAGPESVQEFKVRLAARDPSKTYHVMKFNSSLKIDTTKWTQVNGRPGETFCVSN